MRINSILVKNFRAINSLELNNLTDAIVLSGPNGCGKSSVFDAIRLVKSAYGQYKNNEFTSWFNEFQIDIKNLQADSMRILNDPTKPLEIKIEFKLNSSEIDFLKSNAKDIYKTLRWSQLTRQGFMDSRPQIRDPRTKRADGEIVETEARQMAESLLSVIDNDVHVASLTMLPGDTPSIVNSPVLELMFSVYQPKNLGVIDYQAPNRSYVREQVGNLSLKLEDASVSKSAQHALYDTQNKYNGVKTEMAQSFIREILAEKAGVPTPEENALKTTLDELFSVFFPGKRFLGAIPTKEGGLEFPIQLESGRTHDINELSSGEKEVLLGYLRLRNSAPRNSIILLDEPELHLNPRLARGLPRFYQKHLGKALDNQIWLVSHSDAILREAVQDPSYSVFHMQPCAQTPDGANQADSVNVSADVESAIISLVGDLAAYNPRSKIVLLEGEDSEIDAKIISELFPMFAERVNLVSLGSKRTVRYVHSVLEKASENGKLDARFFSIVDRDYDDSCDSSVSANRQYYWSVYHVENFLLEPKFIRLALLHSSLGALSLTENEIEAELKDCAKETIQDITRIKMDRQINSTIIGSISLSFNPKINIKDGFSEAILRSSTRFSKVINEELTNEKIESMENNISESLNNSLSTDAWKSEFRGRNILKRFSGRHKVQYEILRNLIVNAMRTEQFKPENMVRVTNKILES